MNFRVRRKFVYLLIAACVLGGSLVSVRYLNAFRLHDVQIVPAKLYAGDKLLKEEQGTNLLALPLDRITDKILKDSDVYRVDIDFDLPGMLEIHLNDIVPLALLLARDGQALFCVDKNGVVYKYDYETYGLDYPIITGLENYKLHSRLRDSRIAPLLEQLMHIKESDMDSYLSLTSIDLSDSEKVVMYVEGLPFNVLTDSGSIQKSITKLKLFLMGQNHDLSQIKQLDLRTDGLIIAVD